MEQLDWSQFYYGEELSPLEDPRFKYSTDWEAVLGSGLPCVAYECLRAKELGQWQIFKKELRARRRAMAKPKPRTIFDPMVW